MLKRQLIDRDLAKRWPLALSALVHVVIGVSIRVENCSCAQLVYWVKADP